MLVLSRKTNQKIQIGDSITLTVLEVKGSHVRIGIEAPREVRVLRSELQRFPPVPTN
jgi:carbon storage regulator